jgi:hypothetical protein
VVDGWYIQKNVSRVSAQSLSLVYVSLNKTGRDPRLNNGNSRAANG